MKKTMQLLVVLMLLLTGCGSKNKIDAVTKDYIKAAQTFDYTNLDKYRAEYDTYDYNSNYERYVGHKSFIQDMIYQAQSGFFYDGVFQLYDEVMLHEDQIEYVFVPQQMDYIKLLDELQNNKQYDKYNRNFTKIIFDVVSYELDDEEFEEAFDDFAYDLIYDTHLEDDFDDYSDLLKYKDGIERLMFMSLILDFFSEVYSDTFYFDSDSIKTMSDEEVIQAIYEDESYYYEFSSVNQVAEIVKLAQAALKDMVTLMQKSRVNLDLETININDYRTFSITLTKHESKWHLDTSYSDLEYYDGGWDSWLEDFLDDFIYRIAIN
ncbi:hypothetical protein [Globicatella sulfidifaciens]|uniref:Uncharacterized protein n=1 Tax=Globicatella sulfidifaciens TaxID=136093 RepID=A0A7X8C3Y9_9LACT|nr:hypothetical protein [Globicatella sulfidifaciens]NLJ18428.1 hypothetical protein [Globicatella sulfidifaciens]